MYNGVAGVDVQDVATCRVLGLENCPLAGHAGPQKRQKGKGDCPATLARVQGQPKGERRKEGGGKTTVSYI